MNFSHRAQARPTATPIVFAACTFLFPEGQPLAAADSTNPPHERTIFRLACITPRNNVCWHLSPLGAGLLGCSPKIRVHRGSTTHTRTRTYARTHTRTLHAHATPHTHPRAHTHAHADGHTHTLPRDTQTTPVAFGIEHTCRNVSTSPSTFVEIRPL